QCGVEERGAGAYALRSVQRQRRLGRDRSDHAQPDAGCGRTHRWQDEQSTRPDAAHTHHQHPGPDCSPGQEADPAPAHEVAVGDGLRTTLASSVEPTKDSIVLTDPLLLEHEAAGSGGDLGKHLWKRPVRDRDTTSCPHVMFALEPERTAKNQPNRWIKA